MRNCVQVFLLDWRTDKANDNFKKINLMKKLFAILIFGAACLGARAQYQLVNSDFEEWEAVTYKASSFSKSYSGDEPKEWSSFLNLHRV